MGNEQRMAAEILKNIGGSGRKNLTHYVDTFKICIKG